MQCRHNTIQEDRSDCRMLVVMDFSKYFYKRNVTVTMEALDKKELQEYIHDMVFVFEYWPQSLQLSHAEAEENAAPRPGVRKKRRNEEQGASG